jgi:hypothetical protein
LKFKKRKGLILILVDFGLSNFKGAILTPLVFKTGDFGPSVSFSIKLIAVFNQFSDNFIPN